MKKAILMVSFGTTHMDTRKKTIEVLEEEVRKRFGTEYRIYRAWTSGIIRKRVLLNEGLEIRSVLEELEYIIHDGIKELIIVPSHIINGIENDMMIESILSYKDRFERIAFTTPLLTSDEDYENIVNVFDKEILGDLESISGIDLREESNALILMGHGSSHYSNAAYPAMDYRFKQMGFKNIYIASVEAYPEIDVVIEMIRDKGYRKIALLPFMIVAGEHAKNDMASDEEDSYKSLLLQEGYEVYPVLKGLGEYTGIRKLILEKISEVSKKE